MNKGIVVRYLCTNPSCSFSEQKLEHKSSLVISGASARFKLLNNCPKCKGGLEMLNFVSGSVEITPDDENN